MCVFPKAPSAEDIAAASGGITPQNIALPDANSGAVRVAGDQFRRRRRAASGFSSTVLTSGGLSAAAPVATKILLGA